MPKREIMRSPISYFYQVDKVVIDETGFAQFANMVCPGSYQHQTKVLRDRSGPPYCVLTQFNKVDFQQLDTLSIRPVGIYGSLEKLVELLTTTGCIDNTMYVSGITYAYYQSLTVYCRGHTILDHSIKGGPSTFRTGLYIIDARNVEKDLFYAVYWPEKTTWERDVSPSVSRNRVTFLRLHSTITLDIGHLNLNPDISPSCAIKLFV